MLKSRFLLPSLIALAAALLSGCATSSIGISNFRNPEPKAAFSEYSTFEMKPIEMESPYAGQGTNDKAKTKLQVELDLRINPHLANWNEEAGTGGKTLLIEPTIREIKFIRGGARFWAGAMAGDSAIVVHVIYRDKESGEIVASPEFYQHANAFGGAWTVGGTDNAMLDRMASLITEYTVTNYDKAVGGPTGKPVPESK